MKFIYSLSLLAIAATSGCSSAPRPGNYECDLHEAGAAKCASVEQAYKASQGMSGADASNSQSVFEARAAVRVAASAQAPIVGGQTSGYPDVGEAGMPVFKQPKVLRVWVAPYVDADGNLRSGEYTYFATPGQWNYGDLKKPGAAAAGMFAPARAENLGFVQAAPAPAKAAPPKPAELPKPDGSAVAAGSGSIQGSTPVGAGSSATAPITQPYQRLTGN